MTNPAMTSNRVSHDSSEISLALSGGGFRAMLFHLGSLRRLDELGALSRIDTVSSVSGGSIMAACLAHAMMDAPPELGGRLANFDALANTVHDLTSSDLRRKVFLERIEPMNWGKSLAQLVERELEHRVTADPITALPTRPEFVFCATDMAFGVDWTYEREKAGDYQAGYSAAIQKVTIAHAAAASACFPPIFEPMDTEIDPETFENGCAHGPGADQCRRRIPLTDGGVYDNMGLEPVWKRPGTLLVSDAGGAFEFAPDRGTLSDIKRYPDIMGNQARALRKRWLIQCYIAGVGPTGVRPFNGAYWATGGTRVEYDHNDATGYPKDIATLIAHIRTDLDDFSPAEAAILENQGYLMADVALKVYVPSMYQDAPDPRVPYPDWMDRDKVRAALRESAKQRL